MDWKRLVQFALQGSSDLEQYAIVLVRVSIGLFFAISGANKLFVAGGMRAIYETLVKSKVPFPHQTASLERGVRGFIDRYGRRRPDQHAFHHAERTFASELAR
jgi:putative oxidoreductase